jgi:DNA-binding transcriptional MerR regulator
MLRISEFSRLTRIPAKTLRYYDDIGLFCPAQVDKFTGYRYYSVNQLARLNRILALKELGLSLEQVKDMLDNNLTPEQIRGMLMLKQAELQQQIQQEQMRLLYVENKLKQIEEEGLMSDYEVVIKSVAPVHAATIRATTPDMAHIGQTLDRAFDTLMTYIGEHGKQSDKPEECGITLYLDPEMPDKDILLEAALGIEGDMKATGDINVYTLPAIEMAASVVHHGPFNTLDKAYHALFKWIEANDYEVCGPNREINLAYERGGDQNKYVTELQFPVKKKL